MRRPRRNRQTEALRRLVQETQLQPANFILPLFIRSGEKIQEPIASMPAIFRLSADLLLKEAEKAYALGIPAIILFPVVDSVHKDSRGSWAFEPNNPVNSAIRLLKKELPELCVMVDVALDPYTDHGHDGLVSEDGEILNDETVEVLASQALVLAEVGADVVAPSDMMDGRIAAIRRRLDQGGYKKTAILSYAAKYASAFYGPYREALRSAPRFGDKKTYQMNPANAQEALLECLLDEAEGADMLLIKPALAYLDVISKVKERSCLPVGAFHVSGEYAMVMAGAERGWLDADRALYECVQSIKRAGADFMISYAALRICALLSHKN